MASFLVQKDVEKMLTAWMHGAALFLMGAMGEHLGSPATKPLSPHIAEIMETSCMTSLAAYEGREAEWAAVRLQAERVWGQNGRLIRMNVHTCCLVAACMCRSSASTQTTAVY